jgi:hypothetical protein
MDPQVLHQFECMTYTKWILKSRISIKQYFSGDVSLRLLRGVIWLAEAEAPVSYVQSGLAWRRSWRRRRRRSLRRRSGACHFSFTGLRWRHQLVASRILNYGTASPIRPSVNQNFYLISRILQYFERFLLMGNISRVAFWFCVRHFAMFWQEVNLKQ